MKLYTSDGSRVWSGDDWAANDMLANDIMRDDNFYASRSFVVAGIELFPVHISGYYSEPFFSGWPGVGYSPAPFSMKAFIDKSGQVYRPAFTFYVDNNTGSQYRGANAKTYLVEVYDVPARAISRAESKYHPQEEK